MSLSHRARRSNFLSMLRSSIRRSRFRRLLQEQLEERSVLAAISAPQGLLVQFQSGVSEASKAAALATISAAQVESLQKTAGGEAAPDSVEQIELPSSISVDQAIATLQANPAVKYAEPNWLLQSTEVSNDTNYLSGSLWGMYSNDAPAAVGPSGTTNQYGSQAEEAWSAGYTGSRSVAVGIIDEGIQYTHPDLIDNVWTNPYDPVDGIDNDGNGYVDDIHGWDFYNDDNTIYDGTADDHGTHVAGTIGAEGGNGQGVAGVNWQTTIISAKFLGPNGGYLSDAIEAIDYLTDLKLRHGINIVATNNSWGGGGYSQAMQDAITRAANAGILFIAAAGNAATNNDTTASYPSNYNTTAGAGYDSVIAVAAITSTGAKASYSSYGATTVDLGAPGSSIASTLPNNSYGGMSGTSMATPHVTGAAALYAAYHPGATAAEIKAAILGSTTPTSSLSGNTVTGGRLNVSALMDDAPPESSPTLSIDDASIVEGNNGRKSLSFTISLSQAATSNVTVGYATASGTATADSDFRSATGSVTIRSGATSATVSVSINGDRTVEPNEVFYVNLTNPTGATITDSQGVGTIINDDGGSASSTVQSSFWARFGLLFSDSLASARRIDRLLSNLASDDGDEERQDRFSTAFYFAATATNDSQFVRSIARARSAPPRVFSWT